MSAIPPIGSIGSLASTSSVSGTSKAASGFGDAISKGIDSVAGMENKADSLVTNMAAGGNVSISDVMAATSKANLGMSIVNEIRSRGLEAYQSIINVQV
ncbi:MAG: Flagellar hook-basal body complex protein FliE [Ilumatobacteraceae bacterium]|nr:Flagellar hook-basal body complex protein FliE [Ilumatobacteraceae bacterium]